MVEVGRANEKQCSRGKRNNVILINKSALIALVAGAARRDDNGIACEADCRKFLNPNPAPF